MLYVMTRSVFFAADVDRPLGVNDATTQTSNNKSPPKAGLRGFAFRGRSVLSPGVNAVPLLVCSFYEASDAPDYLSGREEGLAPAFVK